MTDSDQKQVEKFCDAARDLECDLDEQVFDRALGKIAKAPLAEEDEDGADDGNRTRTP